jgi:DNA-binding NarL/FixJ family response regulator
MTQETVEPRHPLNSLSPRELQVFEMLGRGLDVKEIADQLVLDRKTVELYRQRIRSKLHLGTSPGVLRAAILWTDSPPAETESAPV